VDGQLHALLRGNSSDATVEIEARQCSSHISTPFPYPSQRQIERKRAEWQRRTSKPATHDRLG
jgi:hypothetical protein